VRLGRRASVAVGVALTAALLGTLGWFWWGSLLPDSYDVAEMGVVDWGGGQASGHDHHGADATPVAELVADPARVPDVDVTLTVRRDDGRYTVNGSSPGPLVEAVEGDLVQVRLVNENVDDGTTLHWHGVDVPNAADGVAGVTQDAVPSGGEHVYRFVADQAGTYWYHSHQVSHEQVVNGLLGPLVVHPPDDAGFDVDEVAVLHQFGPSATLNGREGVAEVDAAPGDRVRIRVVNTDNGLGTLWVRGGSFEVVAVDGTDVVGPTELADVAVPVPAGGRVDLGVTVPADGVRVDFGGTTAMVLGDDPTAGDSGTPPPDELDLLSYGSPGELGFDPDTADRRFEYAIGRRPGFLDGRPGLWWTVNGRMMPDVPMYMVDEGDVVRMRLTNSSGETHPMHLHGHHAVVLSRDGVAASGSPWWVDSLEVRPGEEYDIAFVADNPGLWMDHCHNLPHAAEGLVAHLMYTGVRSSYVVGGAIGNQPE
jgi:FtsP/CotA-like multicopper oxidase with cupredoxin domain